MRPPSAAWRPRRTLVAPVLYLLATAALVVLLGIPYQRDILAVWLMLGLLCFSMSDLRGNARRLVLGGCCRSARITSTPLTSASSPPPTARSNR